MAENREIERRKGTRRRAPAAGPPPSLIVGIGASAGGLDAFKTFFAHMPADTGMAFVLVQHLAPAPQEHAGRAARARHRHDRAEAADGTPVAANRVYIIPPDATLTIKDGTSAA